MRSHGKAAQGVRRAILEQEQARVEILLSKRAKFLRIAAHLGFAFQVVAERPYQFGVGPPYDLPDWH